MWSVELRQKDSMSSEQRAESDTSQSASGSQTIRIDKAAEEARHESDSSL